MPRVAVFVSILALFLIGCSGEDDGSPEDPNPEPVRVDPLLVYRFAPGDTIRMHPTLDVHVKLGTMGEMSDRREKRVTWVVREVAEDGTASGDLTYDAIMVDSKSPMGIQVKYDSTVEEPGATPGPEEQVIAGLVGKTVHLKMAANGKLMELSGHAAILDPLTGEDPRMRMAAVTWMDGAEKAVMQLRLPRFPKATMAKGESWTVPGEMALPTGGSIVFDMVYTLDDIVAEGDTTVAVLSVKANVTAESYTAPEATSSDPMSRMLSQLQVTGGKLVGVTRFDMLKGRLLRSDLELKAEMELMKMKIEAEVKGSTELIR